MFRVFLLLNLFLSILFATTQKLADDPKDRPIQVRHKGAATSDVLCYTPIFTKGDGYIYLDYCTSGNVKNARYDVFGRISFDINGKHLCITAPDSVTGAHGRPTDDWNYIVLRPCVINDKNQIWKIEDYSIYTSDKRFKIKDYQYYAYISNNQGDDHDHNLTNIMNTWINTIARPGNISTRTVLSWLFTNKSSWTLYYMQNNKSSADDIVNLYYNPENGHIAQYYSSTGDMYCLTSNISSSQDWNWVSWEPCIDNIAKDADKNRYWELFALNGNKGMLRDYYGNFLASTKYGSNWGVPYSAKLKYLIDNNTNSPTSTFILSPEIDNWNRFTYANLQDGLEFCPAPGTSKTRAKRGLPPDFELTDSWAGRLWQIAISTNEGEGPGAGLCGICLLHSYQMILELTSRASVGPLLHGGGYLFDTAPAVNPFISFRSRFPDLANRLEQTRMVTYMLSFSMTRRFADQISPYFMGITNLMLPNYHIDSTDMVFGSEALGLTRSLFNEPVGTIWLVFMYRTRSTGYGVTGHAQILIRLPQGISLIPNNDSYPFDTFRDLSTPFQNAEGIINRYTINGTRDLLFLQYMRIGERFNNPLSFTMSQSNCTGGGEHRRGDREPPSAALVNQCSSGRCFPY